jgi:hypothetical protein
MNLVLSKRADGRLELRPARGYRLLLGLIAGLILSAILFSLIEGESVAAGPVIFFLLALLACLYEERWIFGQREIESRHGLLYPYRKKIISLDTVEGFTVSSFTKGKMRGTDPDAPSFLPSYAVLSIDTTERGPVTVEIVRFGKKELLETKAARIAAVCAKPSGSA